MPEHRDAVVLLTARLGSHRMTCSIVAPRDFPSEI
jgi:hypothetical protein